LLIMCISRSPLVSGPPAERSGRRVRLPPMMSLGGTR
jgi:hypothetical protein